MKQIFRATVGQRQADSLVIFLPNWIGLDNLNLSKIIYNIKLVSDYISDDNGIPYIHYKAYLVGSNVNRH